MTPKKRSDKHICFISSLHKADDKRVHFKEACALVGAGFEVSHVLAENPDFDGDYLDGVRLITYGVGERGLIRRLGRMGRLYRTARATNADVYHCNESDSWLVGVALKMRGYGKLIRDVHELDSKNLAERNFPKPLRPAVEFCAKLAFAIMTNVTDRLVFAKASVDTDFPKSSTEKRVLVQNYAELEGDKVEAKTRAETDGIIRVLHLGAINRDRGWPQMLEALSKANNPNIKLIIVGHFGDYSDQDFLARARELGIEEQVEFRGWIPYEDVATLAQTCDIGILGFQPHLTNFIHALPHKMFDYMRAGLPVIGPSFSVEVARIISSEDCGILIDTRSSDEMSEAIVRLADDADLRERLGARARTAVVERYNWEREAQTLIAMYDSLLGTAPQPTPEDPS